MNRYLKQVYPCSGSPVSPFCRQALRRLSKLRVSAGDWTDVVRLIRFQDGRTGFKKNFVRYWLPVVLGLSMVFWMSSGTFSARNTATLIEPLVSFLAPEIPPEQVGLIHSLIRKAGHLTEYFILGLLLFRAFRGRFSRSFSWRCSFLAVAVLVLWAASEEFHQYFISTRSSSAFDVGIDAAGGVLAQFVSALRCSFREKVR